MSAPATHIRMVMGVPPAHAAGGRKHDAGGNAQNRVDAARRNALDSDEDKRIKVFLI
jgi:hypothetical protein